MPQITRRARKCKFCRLALTTFLRRHSGLREDGRARAKSGACCG